MKSILRILLILSLFLVAFGPLTNVSAKELKAPQAQRPHIIYSIQVDKNGKLVVSQLGKTGSLSTRLNAYVTPEKGTNVAQIPVSNFSSAWCPWGGTGASNLGNGWFLNPPPKDWDFYIDFKVPKSIKSEVFCVTLALYTALAITKKPLLVYGYNYDGSNWKHRVVIGVSAAKKACEILVKNSNCANWLLGAQATVRYTTK